MKGKPSVFKNKCHTEEAKRKNRDAHTGKKQSKETMRLKYENGYIGPMKGKKATEETKEKMRKSKLGKKRGKYKEKAIKDE